MMFEEMHDDLGRPPLMLVDLRPVNRPTVLVTNHEIAEQVSRASTLYPTSVPKTYLDNLEPLLGPTSILSVHGDDWKMLRKRFSPGFAPQHLMTLLPCILDKIPVFLERLDGLARSGREISLTKLLISLTFDIIGAVVMDEDLQAQQLDVSRQGELIKLYSELLGTYSDDKADAPWWLMPGVFRKRRRLGNQVDALLKNLIKRKHSEHLERSTGHQLSSRSILSLSLQDTAVLSPELVNVTCDQLKTFLLAGHDTTSVTLAWVFYEISRTPRVNDTVRQELDNLFGPGTGPEDVHARLLSPEGPGLLGRMPYASAVIKEALRLHAPAGTARYSKTGSGFTVRTPSGEEHCLDGVIIYNCEAIINRDPAVYGDSANTFLPERWLGGADESSATASGGDDIGLGKIPASSWRSFERGPRNCIGQEFAMIEARVIIALVARRFEFIKTGIGELEVDENQRPVLGGDGQYKTKSLLYKVSNA